MGFWEYFLFLTVDSWEINPNKTIYLSYSYAGTLKTEEIQKIAELHVSSRVLFQMPLRNAAVNGCMDARLGISDKISNCQTCKYVHDFKNVLFSECVWIAVLKSEYGALLSESQNSSFGIFL